MKRILLLAVVALFTFSSCRFFGKRVRGNGTIATDVRPITGFTGVDVSSSIDVYLAQDSVYGVKVETDNNLFEYITTYEEGGVLYIKMKRNYNLRSTKGIKVYVNAPAFRKVSASGSCDVYTQGMLTGAESFAIDLSGSSDGELSLKTPSVTADLTGAGSLKLSGETKDLKLEGTGSSKLRCVEMMAENVSVEITGSGSAEVFASVKLDIDVTGSGSVRYKGNPSINQDITGSGSIKRIE